MKRLAEETGTQIEFNSMVAILKRLDIITYEINNARASKDYSVMVDRLVDYYKEISPDLNEEELKIWKDIELLKRFTNPLLQERINLVLIKADNIDLKLRKYAKGHGYLTKNIKDVRTAITNM